MTKTSCCTPSVSRDAIDREEITASKSISDIPRVHIKGGQAYLGTDRPQIPDDGEGPLRRKRVKDFWIAETSITNAQFQAFVSETGYATDAEKYGWSFVFHSHAPTNTQGVPGLEWWRRVDGANWRDVNGPNTAKDAYHDNHPVVQVSWNDAAAFAKWAGGRLPSEAEWEHAARGGQGDVKYPWGDDDPNDNDHFPCNIWQGQFPHNNLAKDGYLATAPAKSFTANAYGLYNLVGNVWEWTAEDFKIKSLKKSVKQRLASMKGYKLSKGGSFLCHKSYCYRYRIAARSGSSPDSSTTHHGFRVVWDAD